MLRIHLAEFSSAARCSPFPRKGKVRMGVRCRNIPQPDKTPALISNHLQSNREGLSNLVAHKVLLCASCPHGPSCSHLTLGVVARLMRLAIIEFITPILDRLFPTRSTASIPGGVAFPLKGGRDLTGFV